MDSGELVGREKHGAHRPQPRSQPGGGLCHRQSRGLEPWERAVREASRESERDSEGLIPGIARPPLFLQRLRRFMVAVIEL